MENATTVSSQLMNNSSSTPSSSSSSSPSISLAAAERRPLIIGVMSVEMLSVAALFAVSAYVVRVMFTTSILHLNLRLLFVWQSVAGMVFAVARCYRDVMNIFVVPASRFPFTGSITDLFFARLGIHANVYVTPLLVVERILATSTVSSYESRQGGHYVFYAMMLLVFIMSAYTAASDTIAMALKKQLYDRATVVLLLGNMAVGVIAYMILLLVLRYNERIYREELMKRHSHNLSERYQRSENIRASRQLLPVVMLHVLQNVPSCVFIFLVVWAKVASTPLEFFIYANIITMTISWFYLALEVTIIMYHPILRRDTMTQLRRWCLFPLCRVLCNRHNISGSTSSLLSIKTTNISGGGAAVDASGRIAPAGEPQPTITTIYQCGLKTMDGRELIPHVSNRYEEHFKNLADFWEMNGPPVPFSAIDLSVPSPSTMTSRKPSAISVARL